MSGFVVDAFCACPCIPEINWNWSEKFPPVHIYCADMWDDNFIPHVYELYDMFLKSMYCKNFKVDAPAFSEKSRELIYVYGD